MSVSVKIARLFHRSQTSLTDLFVYPLSPADKTSFANSVDPDEIYHNEPSHSQSAFYVNLYRAIIGPSG